MTQMDIVKMAVQYMRRVIAKKAKFDIMRLNCLQVAPKTFIPALFGHAKDDKFIQPHHSDCIHKSYAGDKNIVYFDGEHNSSRPEFYYDSVSIFFYNILHPTQIPTVHSCKLEKYYDLGDLKVGAGMDESLLYEIITGIRSASTNASSSSSAPPIVAATTSVDALLSEIGPVASVGDKQSGHNEECCSYTSSNRESWGRCSSLGGSNEESSADCNAVDNGHQKTLEVFATPVRSMKQKLADSTKEEKIRKMMKEASIVGKKPKSENLEKLEALGKRLRHCILKRVNHRRHCSS